MAMRVSSYGYLTKNAFKSLKRNFSISIASMATVAATLFIVGAFILVSLNINKGIAGVESQVEARVFLNDNISDTEKTAITSALEATGNVAKITYESKEQALANLGKQLGDDKTLLEGLDSANPLPASFIVKVNKPEQLTAVMQSIADLPGIYKIQDSQKVVSLLSKITTTIRWTGAAMLIIFISVSLFLIGNTIKLAVYSRRKEIGIMKFVGATDWFIRFPFIIEGMLIGLVGALLAIGIVYGGYVFVFHKYLSAISTIMAFIQPQVILQNAWIFIVSGIVIGAIGSFIAVKKFLFV